MAGIYEEVYRRSMDDAAGFWLEAAGAIDWETPPTIADDATDAPFHRWFSDGRLNTCFNALDRHVAAGRGEQTALIYDSPVTGTVRRYSYDELLELTARFAGCYGRTASVPAIGSSSTCR